MSGIFCSVHSRMFFTTDNLDYIAPSNTAMAAHWFFHLHSNAIRETSPLSWPVHLAPRWQPTGEMEKKKRWYFKNKFSYLSTTTEKWQRRPHYQCREGNARCGCREVRPTIFRILISHRLPQLEQQFQELLDIEAAWPTPLPPAKDLYTRFVDAIAQRIHNIIFCSCGCIDHRPDSYEHVPITYDPLHLLAVPVGVNIPFDFSCGIDLLDERRILLDKDGITSTSEKLTTHSILSYASTFHYKYQ